METRWEFSGLFLRRSGFAYIDVIDSVLPERKPLYHLLLSFLIAFVSRF